MTSLDTRTKEIIISSLKKLMKSNSLSSISVNKIAHESGISRNTFYYHFQDIPAAIHWMFQYELPLTAPPDDEPDIEEYFYRQIYDIFCYVKEHHDIFLCIDNSSLNSEFWKIYQKDVSTIFFKLVLRFKGLTHCSDLYEKDFTLFLTLTLLKVIDNWIYDGMQKSPEELVDFTKSITRIFLGGGHMAV